MKLIKSIRPAEWIFYIVIIIIAFILTQKVFLFGRVPSSSMETTIHEGDAIMGTRFDRDQINRYDIVIFRFPDNPEEYFVKRVIGLPGETIEIKDGEVYSNGYKLDDHFVKELSNDNGKYKVPDNCYFMMGDNRSNSNDSRFWKQKYVEKEDIVAKVKYVLWPSIKKLY